jgi:hypothetical protein
MKLALAAMVLVACDHRPHVESCESDLHGVWIAPSETRWMLLDEGPASLEVYPLFADGDSGKLEIIAAPRVIDLHREGTGLEGIVKRRYMHGADACEAHAAVHVTSCKADALEVVLADAPPPLTFAPCTWPPPAPSRAERWRRE